MKSNIIIEVEFIAGTTIENAVVEAKQKAIEWGVTYIKFTFNGVKLSIGPTANVEWVIDEFSTDREHVISH